MQTRPNKNGEPLSILGYGCMRFTRKGAGIAPEALPFVFERFYKEDRSRGMNTRGSGLGLHICKVLINLSGGQIHAESEEGQWCRFVFTLPAAKP